MLSNNKGFFLIELLISISALFMICFYFVPMLINLKNQALKLEMEKQSYRLLYEELQLVIMKGQTSPLHSITIEGINYQISLRDTDISEQKEVCVKVENNSLYGEKEICGLSE